jgi:ATP-binding protein involved in chromosome partitioning
MGVFSRGDGGKLSEQLVLRALGTVQEPELGGDLVSRRMVKDLRIDGDRVHFTVELTTPACPLKDQIKDECEAALERIAGLPK